MNENFINHAISEAHMAEIKQCLNQLKTILNSYFKSVITKEYLATHQKMGHRSEHFSLKAIDMAEQNPQFVPQFLNVKEARTDMDFYLQLSFLYNELDALKGNVQSSMFLAGAEALDFSNDFYKIITQLAKGNNAIALELHKELSFRYTRPGGYLKKSNPPKTKPAASPEKPDASNFK